MAELRQNPVTGRWVAVAPARSERPFAEEAEDEAPGPGPHREGEAVPSRDPGCPFCPGNEVELPDIVDEIAADAEPGWRCRAVPNRYPAFSGGGNAGGDAPRLLHLREDDESPPQPGRKAPAAGRQEVLIESPRHDRDPARMTPDELEAVVELYRRRLDVLTRDAPEHFPSLFRNRGREAGASLVHPHSQLVATRAAGPARRIREERMRGHRAHSGECLLCELVRREPDGESRIVEEDAHVTAYVPWAPERSLEVWLVPRRHRASFADVEEDASGFARMLGRTLRRIRTLAERPDYNYVLHSSAGADRDDPGLHWFVQIRPLTARTAGFEIDSGIVINPEAPGDDARRLRSVSEEHLRPGAWE